MNPRRHEQPFAKRSLGQNFLVDQNVVAKILGAFNAGEGDTVLEIGPGRGALTEGLIETAGKLFVLEFDDVLAEDLRRRFAERGNFTLVKGDALGIDFSTISPGSSLRLISNLPYNISTAILQRLFDQPAVFSDCLLMFQREVVERITAAPGTKDRGYLTVLTEAHFAVEKLFDVAPSAFRPAPKVVSSIVRLVPRVTPGADSPTFRKLVALAFQQKRKTIANNLKGSFDGVPALTSAGIDPTRRSETLSLDEWMRLAQTIEASIR
jgi:16S rRNA (adenine1518-N6/adenine1519-N6)-dimethyltransferase